MPIVQTMNFDFTGLTFNPSEQINELQPSIETAMSKRQRKLFKYFGYGKKNDTSQLRYVSPDMFSVRVENSESVSFSVELTSSCTR